MVSANDVWKTGSRFLHPGLTSGGSGHPLPSAHGTKFSGHARGTAHVSGEGQSLRSPLLIVLRRSTSLSFERSRVFRCTAGKSKWIVVANADEAWWFF